MGEKTNPRLKKLLIDVVEKQLRENNSAHHQNHI